MKKSLYVISLLILLAVFFFAGTRLTQHGALHNTPPTAVRQILHYVDPMNPTHLSKEPGIAPCGMPMEPVYADTAIPGGAGAAGATMSATPGAITINLQKQQIIGVQLGEVVRAAETSTIRALGRIVPDENRVYVLIATTEGWLEEISGNTTGSLVNKNQLMAQIKVYNYDFFTWQQRYLTEIGYGGPGSVSVYSGTDQYLRRRSSRNQAELPSPETAQQMTMPSDVPPHDIPANETMAMEEPPSPAADALPGDLPPPQDAHTGSMQHAGKTSATTGNISQKSRTDHSKHIEELPKGSTAGTSPTRKNPVHFASKGHYELLNAGLEESQLTELAKSGSFIKAVDLRSPVNGLVLSRKVSPHQKIERGVECFRIADIRKVWIEVDMYDMETKYLQPGIQARVSMPKQDKRFSAVVSEVLPRFDATSRSLKIRLEMDNPGYVFRPDMFVDVEFLVPLPESITVPSSAVIDSGKRQTVYVVRGEGIFEPRTVVTGWQTSDRVEVVSGLQPGEKIVVSGNFLIDSESRMKLAALRLMEDKTEKPLNTQAPVPTAAPEPQTVQPAVKHELPKEKTKDLVCGMTVTKENAIADGLTVEAEGKTYYFCSEDCMEQFKQDPRSFLGEKAADPARPAPPGHGGHSHD